MKTKTLLQAITRERPVGTQNNQAVLTLLNKEFMAAGYDIQTLPFECLTWSKGHSFMKIGEEQFEIQASPYGVAFEGMGEAVIIESFEALQQETLTDKIVILCEAAASHTIQPKDYPFYYPDEDRAVVERLESQKTKAVISMTGQAELSGLNPFPMFNDGHFNRPSAYMSQEKWHQIRGLFKSGSSISLKIDSKRMQAQSSQLIAQKQGVSDGDASDKRKIIVGAHMDTQYETAGALDNATGVAVMMAVMEKLKGAELAFDIDFVPFNSEEYFGASGEMRYLEYLGQQNQPVSLMINLDSPCHIHSKSAVSYYNINEEQSQQIEKLMNSYEEIEKGEAWYAGDHCAFALGGTPCLAVSSSDLFEGALACTHTPEDTLETIDEALIEPTAEFLAELIQNWSQTIGK